MTTRILIVEDDAGLREALSDTLALAKYQTCVASSGEQALVELNKQSFDMVISDIQMGGMDGLSLLTSIKAKYPQVPVILMTAYAKIDDAVKAMREGATDYLSKPFAPQVLINLVERYAPSKPIVGGEPVVEDDSSIRLLSLARKVAKTDATVMVLGPSGSGKEVISRYVHDTSPRANEPFVAINCAAIPENMLEATLFGYEKGAFTGAVQACPGKFEQAQNGTLLLDEITEMDLALQAKLLRVLQEREVERLGSRKTVALNVRVIATSNRDVKQAVSEGVFREDLYYRLNVFPLVWLPLNKRPGDILPLAEHLVQRYSTEQGIGSCKLTASARNKLVQHAWPGNVRELDNVIQRALILCEHGEIDSSDLLIEMDTVWDQTSECDMSEQEADSKLGSELRQQEHQIILDTLALCNGKRKDVAEKLGISPRTLRYKLAKMRESGLDVPA
jgi:two-component system response regulator FlrC